MLLWCVHVCVRVFLCVCEIVTHIVDNKIWYERVHGNVLAYIYHQHPVLSIHMCVWVCLFVCANRILRIVLFFLASFTFNNKSRIQRAIHANNKPGNNFLIYNTLITCSSRLQTHIITEITEWTINTRKGVRIVCVCVCVFAEFVKYLANNVLCDNIIIHIYLD